MRGVRCLPAAVALLLALASLPSTAASRFLPGLKFRVLRTPHFAVYYHQGEETLARSLAAVAEDVHATLPGRLNLPAPRLTHVLLVNQDDASNGWATPLPYNTVMVTAAWPTPSDFIGNTSDWLRLVFAHEYTHVLQLHQSRGWARAVRFVLGRSPMAFPNLFLPQWHVEGLATFAETRATGQGRLASGDSRALVAERTREIGRQRIDALNGGQVEWPGGNGAYLYGGFFLEYLAQRFGEEKLGELSRRSAGRLPYFASPAFRAIFGARLGDLWKDYQRDLTAAGLNLPACDAGRRAEGTGRATGGPLLPGCTRLTHHGYNVSTPRFAPGGREILYALADPHDLPALLRTAATGGEPRRLVTRIGGEQLSVSRAIVFYDRADYVQNVAWRSDLYAATMEGGKVQRLTRNARLVAPDVSTDGQRLACVRIALDGARELALFRIEGSRVEELKLQEVPTPAPEAGASYGAPRWSPDGTQVAAERRMPGGPSEIVVLGVEGGSPRVVASSVRGRNLGPSWTPDGRTLLFASDREGEFGVYSVSLETGETRRVLAVAGGAMSPEVSPGGERLVYVGYTADGYDLFSVPLPPLLARSELVQEEEAGRDASPPLDVARGAVSASRTASRPPTGRLGEPARPASQPYRPFNTLLPRAWSPAGDTANGNVRLGASAAGVDVLGRHRFGVTTLWRVRGGEDAMHGPERARPDWNGYYVYDRWRPSFFVAASEETSFVPQTSGDIRLADATLRERNLSVGVTVPFVSFLRSHAFRSAFNVERDTALTARGERRFRRNALQSGWGFDSANVFGFSVSPEQGMSIGVTSEQVRAGLGADGDADAFTGQLRGYLRLGGRHSVLAARVGGGVSSGDRTVARVYYLGGAQPASGLLDFGSDAFSMLRGFEEDAFGGTRIAVANVEYRFPLWRMERGRGTWPFLLRTLHAAVFGDAGQAWSDRFAWRSTRASFGAEVSLDVVLGFNLPLTVSGGIARPWDGREFRSTAAYLRLGRSF